MKDGKIPGQSTYAYDQNKFYKNRDPRFYKTFAYNGAIWPYKENPNFKMWTYRWYGSSTEANPSRTTETSGANASGIYILKSTSPNASNADFRISGTDVMEMRFAEVLLNLAEAAIGSDKPGEGLALIKLVRERAGIENIDGAYGLAGTSSRDGLFAAVLNERRIEFAYEGQRFWDLRRWLLYNNDFGTVARLGFDPIEGMRRTGYYIGVKTATGAKYTGSASADPLVKPSTGNAPVINRDSSVANYSQYLDYLYDNHFVVTEKNDLDPTSNNWKFKWYDEYYFFGIPQSILSASPYLEQTVGWNGVSGAGTFDPLK
jgi:starch-binding outer membrane protein, SusD/RagB family